MARSYYQNRFTIDDTTGEGAVFFGANPGALPVDQRPTLTIAVHGDNTVSFVVAQSHGARDFAATAEARLLDNTDPEWLDDVADVVVGNVSRGDSAMRQLFVLWARVDPTAPDPAKNLRFGIYFFHHDSCLSCGPGDLFSAGVGQASGGATGGGPH